jgi:hypothetical protein
MQLQKDYSLPGSETVYFGQLGILEETVAYIFRVEETDEP